MVPPYEFIMYWMYVMVPLWILCMPHSPQPIPFQRLPRFHGDRLVPGRVVVPFAVAEAGHWRHLSTFLQGAMGIFW